MLKIRDSLALNDPYELETRLGRSGAAIRNPFNNKEKWAFAKG